MDWSSRNVRERSFKRAALFGVLGALVFLVLGAVLMHFFPALKRNVLFRTDQVNFDLFFVAILFKINLFVVIGFIVGWAFCLLRRE